MKTRLPVRSANNPYSPSEQVTSRLVRSANNKRLTYSPSEQVVHFLTHRLIRSANTLKDLPPSGGFRSALSGSASRLLSTAAQPTIEKTT